MTLALRYAVRSDVGLLREGNEDSAYAGPRLLAVADGMGGHAAGEVASSVTIAAMAKLDSEPPGGDMLAELSSAVAAANARLQEVITANPAVEGMGTTLTALLWSDGHAAVCHIGDSRGYLLREGELYQITHDHTLVQSLVDEGRLSADDVSTHPQRSLLLRALDGRSAAEPDLSVHDSREGDRYLLCSDGLSGVVSDETLRDTLAAIEDPEAVTRQLVQLALGGGGPDNITCIVADVVDPVTSRAPPTGIPVMAGAAANAGDARLLGSEAGGALGQLGGIDDHAGRRYADDGQPQLTSAQPMVAVDDLDPDSLPLAGPSPNGAGPGTARPPRSHRAQPKQSAKPGRRRWPIVTTALVLLLAAVVAGGYIAWNVTQGQYFLTTNSTGDVVIYRGVNQRIAGVSLFRFYQATGIPLAQVPPNYAQPIKDGNAVGNLAYARGTTAEIRQAASQCRQQYLALESWVTAENAYQAAAAKAKALKKPLQGVANPGPQPSVNPGCPSAQAFGVAASAIVPAAAGNS